MAIEFSLSSVSVCSIAHNRHLREQYYHLNTYKCDHYNCNLGYTRVEFCTRRNSEAQTTKSRREGLTGSEMSQQFQYLNWGC